MACKVRLYPNLHAKMPNGYPYSPIERRKEKRVPSPRPLSPYRATSSDDEFNWSEEEKLFENDRTCGNPGVVTNLIFLSCARAPLLVGSITGNAADPDV